MQLVINAGSSTLKWAVFESESSDTVVLEGLFDGFGNECAFSFGERTEVTSISGHEEAISFLLEFLFHNQLATREDITSVVHRVVHGGEKFKHPVLVDDVVVSAIDELSILAPLHNPANLSAIMGCAATLPGVPQVAVFDTSFHQTISREVFLYGIPLELYKKFHIRKYGFHGISHEYIAHVLRAKYGRDVDAISCHLGSGSSITALKKGLSMDTTMGFTPLDGVLMSTRSGEVDPDIPLFLIRQGHYTFEQVEDLLNHESGLYGLTGHSDLRKIWAAAKIGDARSRLALEMLSYRVAYYINALHTAVPNPKAIVFTGGVGEGAWYIRERVCQILQIPLTDSANKGQAEHISAPDSPLDVLVLHTDEQLMMHHLARSVLSVEP